MTYRQKRRIALAPIVFALALNSTGLARAADKMAAPAAVPGVKGEILMQIQQAEDKLVQLAEAIPESKYSWTPAKGVRTVGEVFMHVAAANYGIPAMIGVKAPDGFNFDTYEKSLTKKADIQKALKASFEHVKTTFTAMSDADMEKPQEFFGMKTTGRGTYLLVMSHCHEHLGQQIAYARSNGVVPPWTAKENAEEAKAKQK